MTDNPSIYKVIAPTIDSVSISGFKSIRQLEDFEMKNLNILIGANGAGKSNFIDALDVVNIARIKILGGYVLERGGASNFLYRGSSGYQSKEIDIALRFNQPDGGIYTSTLNFRPTSEDELVYSGDGKLEIDPPHNGYLELYYESALYDFRDAHFLAPLRGYEIIEDCFHLRNDGRNIAPLLRHLREAHPRCYQEIVNTVRLVAPFFDDFLLDIKEFGSAEKARLSWKQKNSDYPFQPYHFSDGTIRFIGLATALLQPDPPKIMLIDEPELGLHPMAIGLLAEMLEAATLKSQLIISTQSPELIDNFSVDNIIVAKRHDGQSTFERLNEADFSLWLEEYSVGELWCKNVIEGGSVHE